MTRLDYIFQIIAVICNCKSIVYCLFTAMFIIILCLIPYIYVKLIMMLLLLGLSLPIVIHAIWLPIIFTEQPSKNDYIIKFYSGFFLATITYGKSKTTWDVSHYTILDIIYLKNYIIITIKAFGGKNNIAIPCKKLTEDELVILKEHLRNAMENIYKENTVDRYNKESSRADSFYINSKMSGGDLYFKNMLRCLHKKVCIVTLLPAVILILAWEKLLSMPSEQYFTLLGLAIVPWLRYLNYIYSQKIGHKKLSLEYKFHPDHIVINSLSPGIISEYEVPLESIKKVQYMQKLLMCEIL